MIPAFTSAETVLIDELFYRDVNLCMKEYFFSIIMFQMPNCCVISVMLSIRCILLVLCIVLWIYRFDVLTVELQYQWTGYCIYCIIFSI